MIGRHIPCQLDNCLCLRDGSLFGSLNQLLSILFSYQDRWDLDVGSEPIISNDCVLQIFSGEFLVVHDDHGVRVVLKGSFHLRGERTFASLDQDDVDEPDFFRVGGCLEGWRFRNEVVVGCAVVFTSTLSVDDGTEDSIAIKWGSEHRGRACDPAVRVAEGPNQPLRRHDSDLSPSTAGLEGEQDAEVPAFRHAGFSLDWSRRGDVRRCSCCPACCHCCWQRCCFGFGCWSMTALSSHFCRRRAWVASS
mmetsp:Transcript_193/g.447  ORF Transcript_193/g.447 Transcript_193/m.447 type:complete len:249 (+) Transcript_193:990-1736(+)